jgi:hypothetical protein
MISDFASLVSSFPVVGFSGSRRGVSRPAELAAGFCRGLSRFSGRVFVGCADGVDAVVRSSFSPASLSVFSVSKSEASRLGGSAFAARSARLVQSVAESHGVLVACPLGACPDGVEPSRSFRGFGSGSWGSVALAVGLGCPVLVIVGSSEFSGSAALFSRFLCVGKGAGFSMWWASPEVTSVEGVVAGVQGSLF